MEKTYEEHVAEIEAQGYTHSDTGCPPFTRAMCSYQVKTHRVGIGCARCEKWVCVCEDKN